MTKKILNQTKEFIKNNYLLIIFSLVVALFAHSYFIYKDIIYDHIMVGTGDQTSQMILFKDYLYKQFSEGNFFYSFTFNGGGNFFSNLSYYYSTSLIYYFTVFITYILEGLGILSNVGVSYWANSVIIISIFRSSLILFITTKLIEYFDVKRAIAFLGATFYAVSVIYFRHVILWEFFADAMIWFPILILGAEKLINNETGSIFTLGVFLALFNNGYFAYQSFIFLIIYIVMRFLIKLKENELSIIEQIKRYLTYGTIGIILSLPGFIPFVLGYLNTSRLSPDFDIPISNFQISHLSGFLFTDNTFIIPILFIILALTFYLYKNKRFLFFSFISIILITFRYNPKIASIMNGLSYPQYRWMYVLYLFLAIAIGIGVQLIYEKIKDKKLQRSLLLSSGITTIIYLSVYFWSGEEIELPFIKWLPIIAVIQIMITVIYVYWPKLNINSFIVASILLSFMTIFISNRQLYYEYGLRNEDYFVNRFDDESNKYHQAVEFIEEDAEDFYRLDYFEGNNYSLPFQISTFNLYSSFQNKYQQYFERDFQILSDRDSNGEYSGLGKRKILNSLFQVDYVVAPSNATFRVPEGYEEVATFDDLNVYKNDIPLEFIHPVKDVYSAKDFSEETFKDEIVLNAAITDDIPQTKIMKNNQSLIQEIPYTIDYQNIEFKDETLLKPSEKNQLTISVEDLGLDTGSVMVEYTLEPGDGHGEFEYSINDYNLELNGANLPYSEQRYRNRIPINNSNEIRFEFDPNTDYFFQIHNVHYVTDEELQERVREESNLEYDYNIKDGFIRVSYNNVEEYPLMILPVFNELGWNLQVNGKDAEILNVNSGMIGFEIPNGEVEIELKFNQPFLTETLLLSAVAIITLILLERYRHKEKIGGKHV